LIKFSQADGQRSGEGPGGHDEDEGLCGAQNREGLLQLSLTLKK